MNTNRPTAIAAMSILWFLAASAIAGEALETVNVTDADRNAAARVVSFGSHTRGALNPAGGVHAPKTFRSDASGAQIEVKNLKSAAGGLLSNLTAGSSGLPPPTFYPADLAQGPGPVVLDAQFHNVYVNCVPSCWDSPAIFENHLYASSFLHLVNQYVGSAAPGRYSQGKSATVSYPNSGILFDNLTSTTNTGNGTGDIASILHAVAAKFGTGYEHVYHVFIPKGTDVCLADGTCYSPDNINSWFFCGYHGYQEFPDIGHVLFTVEPYEDAYAIYNGLPFYACTVGQPDSTVDTYPTPNGVEVDSQANVLSHETFETITDPDGDAWLLGPYSLAFYGLLDEIGDLCVSQTFLYSAPILVAGKPYYVQPEYSNKYHACTMIP